jgi:hypothetical protein
LGRVDSQTIGVRLEMIWQIDKTRLERIFQTKAAADLIMTDFSETDIAEWRLLARL